MTPEDALRFAVGFVKGLPDGWGFLAEAHHDGMDALILTETGPPFRPGWMLWISKELSGGRILKGGVLFGEEDTAWDVEVRAWSVLGALRVRERQDAAMWN